MIGECTPPTQEYGRLLVNPACGLHTGSSEFGASSEERENESAQFIVAIIFVIPLLRGKAKR